MTMESITISPSHLDVALQCSKDVRTQPNNQSHLFVRGPIPLWWMETAARECGPSSLTVGLILFFRSGLKRRPAPISKWEIEKWGLTRNTRDSALKKLSSAQLITMHPNGRRRFPVLDLSSRKPRKIEAPPPPARLQKPCMSDPLPQCYVAPKDSSSDFLTTFSI